VPHKVVFAPEAEDDLLQLYHFISEFAGDDRAMAYIEQVEKYCRGFENFPERGRKRDDLFPGLRVVGFKRRITIAFHISPDTVTFDRILYGGRDLDAEFDGA